MNLELSRSTQIFKVTEDDKGREYIKIKTLKDSVGRIVSQCVSTYYVKKK